MQAAWHRHWEGNPVIILRSVADVDAFFPEAAAAGERGDRDWPEDSGLERRGEALGRSGGCATGRGS